MRSQDLSPDRRQYLVHCPDYPHVHAFVPPPTPRVLTLNCPTLFAAYEALGALREAARRLPRPDLVTRSLARREAVQSSQIEGTQTGLSELLAYECTGDASGLPGDVRVTENYVRALDVGLRALEQGGGRQALTVELVRQLHGALLEGVPYRGTPGEFRLRQVWIGSGARIEDATFVPPPPQALDAAMRDMEVSMLRYTPDEGDCRSLSILTQIAIAHAQFETIHPFLDGNGRVGRLLMPLMLAAEGYPPLYLSGHLLRHRRRYYECLAGVQLRGEWSDWVEFLAQAVVASAQDAVALAKDLAEIRQAWLPKLADLRADAAALRLADLLTGYPVVSVNQARELLGVSFPTANKAVDALVARGILTVDERRRDRVFVAGEVVERLGR